jgi:enoyl-CoA hydratase
MQACQDANDDPDVRAVILTGAGEKAFSVGRDLKELAGSPETNPIENRQNRPKNNDSRYVAAIEKPVIAAINGFALGGGLELALCCDIRIAAEHARVGLPEAARGLIPGSGGTQRLPRIVGPAKALEIIFTAEAVTAQEALAIGLVNKVVPAAELMATAEEMAHKITRCAPLSLRYIKEAVRKGLEMPLDQALALETDLSTLLSTSDDAREGPRAFAEKRAPNWQGR